jgi:hypothetical protein
MVDMVQGSHGNVPWRVIDNEDGARESPCALLGICPIDGKVQSRLVCLDVTETSEADGNTTSGSTGGDWNAQE